VAGGDGRRHRHHRLFSAWQIIKNWRQVVDYDWDINVFYLILAMVSVVVTFFIFSSVWKVIILSLHKNVSFRKSFKDRLPGQPGTLYPGQNLADVRHDLPGQKGGDHRRRGDDVVRLSQVFAIPVGVSGRLDFSWGISERLGSICGRPVFDHRGHHRAAVVFIVSLLVVVFPRLLEGALNGCLLWPNGRRFISA